jgi:hypothetical protein
MSEAIYHVTASEGVDEFVPESKLRETIHGLFCSCKAPETCTNEYLADFDDGNPPDMEINGGAWDLEDGWVRFDPVQTAEA